MEHLPRYATQSNMDIVCLNNRLSYKSSLIASSGLLSQVLGSLGGRPLGGHVRLGQATVDDEIRGINEAALVAGQEDDGVGLFDGLSETAGREVNLATEALLLVITEPVLQQGGVERSGAQRVEPETCIVSGSQTECAARSPSLACTMANSRVIAKTAPLLAV